MKRFFKQNEVGYIRDEKLGKKGHIYAHIKKGTSYSWKYPKSSQHARMYCSSSASSRSLITASILFIILLFLSLISHFFIADESEDDWDDGDDGDDCKSVSGESSRKVLREVELFR